MAGNRLANPQQIPKSLQLSACFWRRARRSRPTGFASLVASCETPTRRVGEKPRVSAQPRGNDSAYGERLSRAEPTRWMAYWAASAQSRRMCEAMRCASGVRRNSGFHHMVRPGTRRHRRGFGARSSHAEFAEDAAASAPWGSSRFVGYPCYPCETFVPEVGAIALRLCVRFRAQRGRVRGKNGGKQTREFPANPEVFAIVRVLLAARPEVAPYRAAARQHDDPPPARTSPAGCEAPFGSRTPRELWRGSSGSFWEGVNIRHRRKPPEQFTRPACEHGEQAGRRGCPPFKPRSGDLMA